MDQSLDAKFYRLLMVFSSLEPLKIKILIILAHLSPQQVSATELTYLLGYSKKARTIYRGVLDELARDNFIIVNRITPKHFSINISPRHPIMAILIELVSKNGKEFTNRLLDDLEDRPK